MCGDPSHDRGGGSWLDRDEMTSYLDKVKVYLDKVEIYLDKVEIHLDKVEIYLDKVEIQPWIVTHSCSIATLGFGAPQALS